MLNEIALLTLPERVAVLETKMQNVELLLTQIDNKLDDLVQLKAKGLGAISLVATLVGSGLIGLIITLWNVFRGPHL